MTAPDPILVIDNPVVRFGGRVAIDALACAARRGDITAIIGPNGGGGGRLCEEALPAIRDRPDGRPNGKGPESGAQRLTVHPSARSRAPRSRQPMQVPRA